MVRLKLKDGFEKLLSNLRYILRIKKNLILVSILNGLGHTTKIEEVKMKVLKGSLIILKVAKINGLYILEGHTDNNWLLLLKNIMIRPYFGTNA